MSQTFPWKRPPMFQQKTPHGQGPVSRAAALARIEKIVEYLLLDLEPRAESLANKLGISRQQVHRDCNRPEFAGILRRRLDQSFSQIVGHALNVIVMMMDDTKTHEAVRFRIASWIVDRSYHLAEVLGPADPKDDPLERAIAAVHEAAAKEKPAENANGAPAEGDPD